VNDEKYTASQLKSLILKYQKELLEFYERRTLSVPEHTPDISPVVQDTKDLKRDALKTEPTFETTKAAPCIEPKMPCTVDDEWDDCSPPPSMLRPCETEPAPRIEPKMPCTTDDEWDDCSPPPSMLRPRETEPTPRIEPKTPCTVDDEWEDCSPPPSMLRPRETKTKPALCKETAKLHDAMECASLQVRVTSGGQVLPVAGARVTIFYLGESNKKKRKDDVTDKNGNTQVFSIPISAPSAPCTIEVSASGFCSARYVGIELCSGTPTTQQIDLIELPPGHKSNLLILYDKLPIL
jgi:hypothetical protein